LTEQVARGVFVQDWFVKPCIAWKIKDSVDNAQNSAFEKIPIMQDRNDTVMPRGASYAAFRIASIHYVP